MNGKFLRPCEYGKTRSLADICFPPACENEGYYSQDIKDSRVAVLADGEEILSMAHLRRMLLSYPDGDKSAWYICYVCTAPEYRHRGCMDTLLRFVLDALRREGEELAFLAPVDKAIYRHLGFVHDWRFAPEEAALLYADDELSECSACLLNGDSFVSPQGIRRAQSCRELVFQPFTAQAAAELYDFFSIRPNKSCDSVPLDTLVWARDIGTQYCVADGRCLLLADAGKGTVTAGLPLADERELSYYFWLLERYVNDVLHKELRIYLADTEGTETLQKTDLLDGFSVEEDPEIYDYIYSGEALRTLAGKALAKKRNHVHNFEKQYAGRWEYRRLRREDTGEIKTFLDGWSRKKAAMTAGQVDGEYVNIGEIFSESETLSIDEAGTALLMENPALFEKLHAGGIWIDDILCAFSIGSLNRRENMAVIEIEKADPDIPGLYQIINRELLLHEFPEAALVNREDDAGLPGLRKAKMSYKPLMLEKKYNILQKSKAATP